jgi:transposase
MPVPVCLRPLTAEERMAVETLARSRTAPARRVERARIVWRATRGETPPAIAATLGVDVETVRRRIRRFDAEGLAALEDRPRPGRPATYSPDAVAAVIAAALTAPRRLGLPFASWTLDRLGPRICWNTRASRCGAAGSTRSCSPRACAGVGRRPGSANASIPRSRKKGPHRDALLRAAAGQRSRLPR